MRNKLIVCHASVLICAIIGVFDVCAENTPSIIKRGGVSDDERWTKEDVIEYLRLPRLASMDGKVGLSMDKISERIETAKSLDEYKIVKKANALSGSPNSQYPVMSFELQREKRPVLRVGVYDYQAWNVLCDMLLKSITGTFSLWNVIPEAYTVESTGNEYILTRKGGQVHRWYFSLKSFYVIAVDAGHTRELAMSEEDVIAEVDKVVRELVLLIEGKEER